MKTKQVIVIRKDLKMRRGKQIAQGAHASMAAILEQGYKVTEYDEELRIPLDSAMRDWLGGIFTKICVSVNSEEVLLAIYEQAKDAKICRSLIQDAGLTEFGGVPTLTAVAVGPAEAEDVDKITGDLKLL